jgi:hypothetical protein
MPSHRNVGPFFIVGCPRSGTTLLRLMLDRHPRLCVPPETEWIVGLAPDPPERTLGHNEMRSALDGILAHPKFGAWLVEPEEVRRAVRELEPGSYAALVDAVFGVYMSREGKARWGDKTPDYVRHIPLLSRLFPAAPFLHLIRDGREVAASLGDQPWWPGSAADGARWWVECVEAGRSAEPELGLRYCELRLEDLVKNPDRALRRVCAALGEEFVRAVLEEYSLTEEEFEGWGEEDARSHRHLTKPPTAGLRDWRAELSHREQDEVEAICAPLLVDLGYGTTTWAGDAG